MNKQAYQNPWAKYLYELFTIVLKKYTINELID